MNQEINNNQKELMREWKPVMLGIIAILVVFVGLFIYHNTQKNKETEKPVTTKSSQVKESPLLQLASDDWVKGNPEAQVTLVEYLDFECEACGAYYPIVKQLEKEFEGKLKVVTRYFPLPGHKNSMEAALAAQAAGEQGKFFEMHDLLFESQKEWGEKPLSNPDLFLPYAEKLGLDMKKFNEDRKKATTIARVDRNKKEADQLKLNGTPSFFLNGKAIKSPNTLEDFRALIQKEVEKAK